MASIIKADTLQSTTAIVFVLNSSGTEYARFDADGDLGIGTTAPDSKLHILNSVGASLRVGYLGGNTNYYDATTHTFRSANGSPSSFISNQYGIGLASTVPTSGVGIAFPGTQTSSSDANTLDDYEEGTWTPSIGGTATYNTQTGTYRKIGSLVSVIAFININVRGTGSTGQITGLPFAQTGSIAPISAGYYSTSATSLSSVMGYLNTSTINVSGVVAGGSISTTDPVNIFQNGTQLYFTCTYYATT